jgi:hypothetical protein
MAIGHWRVWVGPALHRDNAGSGRELSVRDAKIAAEKQLRFAIAKYELKHARTARVD